MVVAERLLSPTYSAMTLRAQWSDEHLYVESNHSIFCSHCGRKRGHPDHVTREEDKAAVMRWADRYRALHG